VTNLSDTSVEPSLTGYGATFYPGVADLASAMPIEITPGTHAEINLKLVTEPLYHVSGTVTGYPAGGNVFVQVMCSGEQSTGTVDFNESTGRFRVTGVPKETCRIIAQSHDAAGPASYGSLPLHLTSDLAGVRVAMIPGTNLRANVRMETTRNESGAERDSGPNPPGPIFVSRAARPGERAHIQLFARDEVFARRRYDSEAVATGDESTTIVKDVPPGTFSVRVEANGSYYVESATSGAVNLLDQGLVIAQGATPTPLDIVLRDDGASLEVAAARDRVRVAASILLLPENSPRMAQVRPVGASWTFRFGRLAPGRYRVLALEANSNPEYESAEFVRKYASEGQEITLAPNQNATISVEMAKAAD